MPQYLGVKNHIDLARAAARRGDLESSRRHLAAVKAANVERAAKATISLPAGRAQLVPGLAIKTTIDPVVSATLRGRRTVLVPGATCGSFYLVDTETGEYI